MYLLMIKRLQESKMVKHDRLTFANEVPISESASSDDAGNSEAWIDPSTITAHVDDAPTEGEHQHEESTDSETTSNDTSENTSSENSSENDQSLSNQNSDETDSMDSGGASSSTQENFQDNGTDLGENQVQDILYLLLESGQRIIHLT